MNDVKRAANDGIESITKHEDYDIAKNNGAAGAIATFHQLHSELGCDIEFRMPWSQEIVVTAPGNVSYWLSELSTHTTDSGRRFRFGMEINGERTEAKNPNNMPESYLEALTLLQQMVEHDPQNDIEPQPTHMAFRIPVSE